MDILRRTSKRAGRNPGVFGLAKQAHYINLKDSKLKRRNERTLVKQG
eukprot:CAMPEP_0181397006 /NCGR_PEP_ID=MMETSP1110-20121109/233_1 /TAXON_ID=174948 /ORGANISM="Symbiodinium sp., Strain CCMP421" /LENGTH=46 /DNA_ID= /DNA_START= /DNA_END= /DNA_ORIENTATION=